MARRHQKRRDGPWGLPRIVVTTLVAVLAGAGVTGKFFDWLSPGLFRPAFGLAALCEIALIAASLLLLTCLDPQPGSGH